MELLMLAFTLLGLGLAAWPVWLHHEGKKKEREKTIEALRTGIRELQTLPIERAKAGGMTKVELAAAGKGIVRALGLVRETTNANMKHLKGEEITSLLEVAMWVEASTANEHNLLLQEHGVGTFEGNYFANQISSLFTPKFSWIWSERKGKLTEKEKEAALAGAYKRAETRGQQEIAKEYAEAWTELYVSYRKEAKVDQWTAHWLATQQVMGVLEKRYNDEATDWSVKDNGDRHRKMGQREIQLGDFVFERACNVWKEGLDW